MNRSSRWLLAVATGVSVIGTGGAVAAASGSPTRGAVRVWVTPGSGAVDRILLTGIIADHGTATSINKAGKVDKNGTYVRVALRHGTFLVNAVAFNKDLDKIRPTVDKGTCSFWGTGSGDVTLSDGTGAYAGITGRIRMTTSFAAVLPRFASGAKKGQCNANGRPVTEFDGELLGAGSVSL